VWEEVLRVVGVGAEHEAGAGKQKVCVCVSGRGCELALTDGRGGDFPGRRQCLNAQRRGAGCELEGRMYTDEGNIEERGVSAVQTTPRFKRRQRAANETRLSNANNEQTTLKFKHHKRESEDEALSHPPLFLDAPASRMRPVVLEPIKASPGFCCLISPLSGI